MRAIFKVGKSYELIPKEKSTLDRLLRLLSPGLEVEALLELERPRSLPQHRRYFGRLRRFTTSLPENVILLFWEILLRDLAINGHLDELLLHEILKRLTDTKSTAFQKMSQDQANEFNRLADEFLDRWEVAIYGEVVSNDSDHLDSDGLACGTRSAGPAVSQSQEMTQKQYRLDQWNAVMGDFPPCFFPDCEEPATEAAHRIPQWDGNIKKYGFRVIHHRFNLEPSCKKHNSYAMKMTAQERVDLLQAIHDDLGIERRAM